MVLGGFVRLWVLGLRVLEFGRALGFRDLHLNPKLLNPRLYTLNLVKQ